jgi:hypothetical protein
MLASRVYADEWEVEPRLAEFNATRDELLHVVGKIVGARADAIDDDPLGSAGQFAYIFGTRNIRGVFKPKGWERYREENVEAVRDPATGRQIIYQSVDLAGSPNRSPLAIRGKGSGARRLIDAAQGSLFSAEELPERLPLLTGEIPLVWYFCVSVNYNETGECLVGAELSLPLPGDNFAGFLERIFVHPNAPWGRGIKPDAFDEAIEFEPRISRK